MPINNIRAFLPLKNGEKTYMVIEGSGFVNPSAVKIDPQGTVAAGFVFDASVAIPGTTKVVCVVTTYVIPDSDPGVVAKPRAPVYSTGNIVVTVTNSGAPPVISPAMEVDFATLP